MATSAADFKRRTRRPLRAAAPARSADGRQIDRDSVEPAYVQLAAILRERIAQGEYEAGDQLPTEGELVEAYELSPVTVRRAIKILVDEGAVEATRGRGTFVRAASVAAATFGLDSFREILADPDVTVRILGVGMVQATGRIARLLAVPVGTRVIRIRRLMLDDGRPLLYHQEWMRYDPRRPVVETEFGLTALNDLFEGRRGGGPKRGRIALRASSLRPEEARHLAAPEGSTCFLLEHHFFGFDDQPFSWGFFVCLAKLLTFETTVGFAGASGGLAGASGEPEVRS